MNLISQVLSRRKKIVLIFTVLGVSISALYNEVIPPVYKTSVSLLFDLPNLSSDSGGQKSIRDLRNHLEEIRGLATAKLIASQLPISLHPFFRNPSDNLDTLDYYSDQIHRSLSAGIIPSTDIIRIAVGTSNPALSYAIADKAANIVKNRIQASSSDSLDLQEIVKEQLAYYKEAVDEADRALQAFKKNTAGIILTNTSRANLKKVTEADILSDELTFEQKSIQQKLTRMNDLSSSTPKRLAIDELSAELKTLKSAITNSQFSVLQGNILGLAESDPRLLESKGALQQARNTFANRVIDLIEAKAVQNPEVEINSNLAESINLQIALADLEARKQACVRIKTGYDEGVSELAPDQIELSNLLRKKDVNERIYLMLLEKREAVRIRLLENRSRVRVIDTPRLQRNPSSPNKRRNLILGLVLGSFFGLLIALALESTATGLTIENVQASAPWSLLSSIPRTERSFEMGIAGEDSKLSGNSIEVEAYRELRTNLKFLNQDDPNVLLVTSLSPNAGKSTITANLAVSYTRLGMKVLMIDAAIRQPRLHQMFAINQEPGLTDILMNHQTLVSDLDDEERRQRFYESGTRSPVWSTIQNLKRHKNVSDLVENFQDFSTEAQNNNSGVTPPDTQYLNFLRVSLIESIQSTSVKNLKILASGKTLFNFSELVSTRSMNWLLEVTRKKYDIILIDSAPLPLVPDSKVLSTLVDGTILVLDTESQNRKLTKAIKHLEKSKIKVAGIVMNKVEPKLLSREKYLL